MNKYVASSCYTEKSRSDLEMPVAACARYYLCIPESPTLIQISYGEKGKPRLKSAENNLQFNLSHAGELALLAVSTEYPIGIDLEFLGMRKNLRRIARKMFDHKAFRQLESLDDEALKQAFFLHWTALEASAKAEGRGIFPAPWKAAVSPVSIFSRTPDGVPPSPPWVVCRQPKTGTRYSSRLIWIHK